MLYGMIGMLGVRIWVQNRVDFSDQVNLTTAAVALIVGIADYTWEIGGLQFAGIALGTGVTLVVYHLMSAIARARRTARLECIVHHLGLALGGRPAASFAKRLMLPVSDDTLLRVVRRRGCPSHPAPTVIGIDDWAWRRGRRYGTIIVDLENENRLIDLLRDRKAETAEAWLKAHPGIEIVGVESALYPSMWNAIQSAQRAMGGATLAEGIAVKNVGALTQPIIRALVSDILLVDEEHIERAVNAYLTLQKTMAEGAGAAGLAAMLAEPGRFKGKRVGLVLCGGNIDPRILASIMIRELERESRIVSFRLTIADRPGLLGQIATMLGKLGANILEVDHRRMFLDVPAKGARLDVTVETRDAAHADEIFAAFEAEGFAPLRVDPGNAME